MFGWSEKENRMLAQIRIMRAVAQVGKSTIFVRINEFKKMMPKKRIDLWWRGKHSNGDIMLLLAYLLNLNADWKTAQIFIHTIILEERDSDFMRKNLQEMIDEIRIKAEPKIIIKPHDKTIVEIMQDYSKDADVVFLGLMIPAEGKESEYLTRMDELSKGFKTTIFVRNGEKFSGELL